MKVPDSVCRRLRDLLWAQADTAGWSTLSDQQKTGLYEEWIRSDKVGQVLSRYLDMGSIRVYIKDTIIKPYGRERIKDFGPVATILGLPIDIAVTREYIKPHGRLLRDGRVICWGLARDWKAIVLAVFERSREAKGRRPHAAVLMYASGKTAQPAARVLIEEIGNRLEVERLLWYEA